MNTKTREKLLLTKQQAQAILWDEQEKEEYKIISKEIIDNSRWSIISEIIIQRLSDKKFFRDNYSKGATESQDEQPWEYTDPDFTEVFPIEKTITVYE